jgi:hypothetical protein
LVKLIETMNDGNHKFDVCLLILIISFPQILMMSVSTFRNVINLLYIQVYFVISNSLISKFRLSRTHPSAFQLSWFPFSPIVTMFLPLPIPTHPPPLPQCTHTFLLTIYKHVSRKCVVIHSITITFLNE